MHLAHKSALGLDDEGLEPPLGSLAVELSNQLAEGQACDLSLGRRGLPRPQPVDILGPQVLPLTTVPATQGAQDDRGRRRPDEP